jgi:hypothetical protein
MSPAPRIGLYSVGWWAAPRSRSVWEGRHLPLAAIMPECELVEVRLQLVLADAVVGADQPLLYVTDCAIRQEYD